MGRGGIVRVEVVGRVSIWLPVNTTDSNGRGTTGGTSEAGGASCTLLVVVDVGLDTSDRHVGQDPHRANHFRIQASQNI